jgi:hypothetical protein
MSRNNGISGGVGLVGLLLCVPLAFVLLFRISADISFTQGCGGHLKRAADANSVALAESELQMAVDYLDRHNMTSGYTSVVYRTPDEDVGFWHDNLASSLATLKTLPKNATQLEQSNVLMKLRETILDHGKDGDSLTTPDGISIYPNNAGIAAGTTAALVAAIIGALMIFAWGSSI